MAREPVVLIHGLWTNGLDMTLLRRRLDDAGFHTHQFSYPSVRMSPADSAEQLHKYIAPLEHVDPHFVAHSLGGLVLRHLFSRFPAMRAGRSVTLGTPHSPSWAAGMLAAGPVGRAMLGRSVDRGLLGDAPAWPPDRELGTIGGTLRFGLGLFVPGVPAPGDGTVAVAETRCAAAKDHAVLPVSHFGLLISRRAADEVIHFLRHGRFSGSREPDNGRQ